MTTNNSYMTKQAVLYDRIGKTYDTFRIADPEIVVSILKSLKPKKGGRYLDVGCGSGNYTIALAEKNLNISGLDISEIMLKQAEKKNKTIPFIQGDVQDLPFSDNHFDGVTCILATHHFPDRLASFKEIYRVVSQGNFIIFTTTPERIEKFWLREYFPDMIANETKILSSYECLKEELNTAGFTNISCKPFRLTSDTIDLFMMAGKYKPEIFLDPEIRSGMSSFARGLFSEEIERGLKRLENDIESGRIQEIMRNYEDGKGDCFVICATK